MFQYIWHCGDQWTFNRAVKFCCYLKNMTAEVDFAKTLLHEYKMMTSENILAMNQ